MDQLTAKGVACSAGSRVDGPASPGSATPGHLPGGRARPVHGVGRAAARSHAPRMIELHWGDPKHPKLAIVGKGVCFDSGGLDIKPASGMLLSRKLFLET